MQVGAELYGHAGIAADREVLRLMLSSLAALGLSRVHVDLGHVGEFRALVDSFGLDADTAAELFAAMRIKDVPAIAAIARSFPDAAGESLMHLTELYGEADSVLTRAADALPPLPPIEAALSDLRTLVASLRSESVAIQVDLAELRDLDYHNGVVFSAYADGHAAAIGRGGRYDNIGAAFGRMRPATGFSLYPRQLAARVAPKAPKNGILAPDADDPKLLAAIEALRAAGEVVVVAIEGDAADPAAHRCDRRLRMHGGEWKVHPATGKAK
jgi:ATP phosphoribosyltransferase regulatory subunit